MTEIQNFRSSFRGFHREDVVAYIAFLNNRHSAQHAGIILEYKNTFLGMGAVTYGL